MSHVREPGLDPVTHEEETVGKVRRLRPSTVSNACSDALLAHGPHGRQQACTFLTGPRCTTDGGACCCADRAGGGAGAGADRGGRLQPLPRRRQCRAPGPMHAVGLLEQLWLRCRYACSWLYGMHTFSWPSCFPSFGVLTILCVSFNSGVAAAAGSRAHAAQHRSRGGQAGSSACAGGAAPRTARLLHRLAAPCTPCLLVLRVST